MDPVQRHLLIQRVAARHQARPQTPKHFYLVFPLKNLKALERGVLVGVKGLSASPTILKGMLGMLGRNLVLRMPGEETVRLNSLSEIDYRSPKKILEKGLGSLARVNNTSQEYIRIELLEFGMRFFRRALQPHLAKEPSLMPLFSPSLPTKKRRWRPVDWKKLKGFSRKIRSLEVLARWFKDLVREWTKKRAPKAVDALSRLPDALYVKAMVYSIRQATEIYKPEKEWSLERGTPLQIPEGSVLYVTYHDLPPEWLAQYRKNGREFLETLGLKGWDIDDIEDRLKMNLSSLRALKSTNLAGRYKIVLLDPLKFKAVKPGSWV